MSCTYAYRGGPQVVIVRRARAEEQDVTQEVEAKENGPGVTTPSADDPAGSKALLQLVEGPAVAALAGLALVAFCVVVWASPRGIDFTDEGIYLQYYRWWKVPELTFTGAPMLLGPVFELLGWSVPALRVTKAVLLVASAALLGHAAARYLFAHLPAHLASRRRHALVILSAILGSFSLYSWLPQSPGYNDLAVMISSAIVAATLLWALADGRRAAALGALIGAAAVCLLFVKWPSAVMVAAGVGAFQMASGRTRRIPAFVVAALGGAVGMVLVLQIAAGPLADRVTNLVGASDTVLEGLGFFDAYLRPYATSMTRALWRSSGLVVPTVVPFLALAVVVGRRSRVVAAGLITAGLGVFLVSLRIRGHLTGGEVNVVALESTFPAVYLAVIGSLLVAVLLARVSPMPAPESSLRPQGAGRSLAVGVALVSLMPMLQAIGTGNPPFRIAFCAGAAWGAAAAMLGQIAIWRGGPAMVMPATMAVVCVAGVGVVAGVDGLRTDSFRVGPLAAQTVAVPSAPALDGLRVDPSTASLVAQVRGLLDARGLLEYPAFSSANGTGLTFAVGLRHPPAGLFIEEPLPGIVRSRIREACRIDAIGPEEPPVVISIGDEVPAVTAEELRLCGIDFPSSYEPVRVMPEPAAYSSFRRDGVTVWIPRARS